MVDEEKMKKMETGELDEDVYTEEGREELVEEDEISDVEEGFVKGYEEGGANCDNCGKVLVDESMVEEEIGGKECRFCCGECAK